MAFQVKAGGNWVNVTDPQVKVAGSWTPVKEVLVKDAGTWKSVWTREVDVRGNNSPTDSFYAASSTYGNTKDGSLGDTSTYDSLYVSAYNVSATVSRIINFDSTSTSSSTLYLQYGGQGSNGGYTSATARLKYSTDGGSTYTTIATFYHTSTSSGPTSYSVALPANVNLSNVKVKYETDQTVTSVESFCMVYNYGPPPDFEPYCTQYAYDNYYSTAEVKLYDCYIKYS